MEQNWHQILFLNPCSWLLCSSIYQKLVSYIRLSETCGKQQWEELKCHPYIYISTPVSWCFPISLSHRPYCLNLWSRELRDMLAQGYGFALCCRLGSCLEDIQMLLISALFSFEMWHKNEREKRISLHVCFVGNHLSLTSWVSLCCFCTIKCLSHPDCSLAQFLGKLYMKLCKHTLSHVSFQPP